MGIKIISESANNIYKYKNIEYTCLSNTIDTTYHRYEDNRGLDSSLMMEQLEHYHGKTKIISPSIMDYYNAFGDDISFVIPNMSTLSDSYQNAMLAKAKYEKQYPDRKVYVLNSNTTGPALKMISEKLFDYVQKNVSTDTILENIKNYIKSIHIVVACKKPSASIRKQFTSKNTSTIQKTNTSMLIAKLKEQNFTGKKLSISYNGNQEYLSHFIENLTKTFGHLQIDIHPNSGINTYYFGYDAILVGYEK